MLKNDYVTVHTQEGWGTFGDIGLRMQLAYSRKLTDEESFKISNFIREMVTTINSNTYKMSDEFKRECEEERRQLLNCFKTPIYVKETTNEYGGSTPWFLVTTKRGVIKIGWRKRVILIDWADSDIKHKAEEMFPNDDVTKYDKTIHAWSYEKATEYIDNLLF